MKEINRTIVSALVFSKDGKLLMGQKDPEGGGVFADAWHIPGGGVDEGETLLQAIMRELKEEVGLDISTCEIIHLEETGTGRAEKVLKDTGEKVWCNMQFNYFEIHLDKNANEIELDLRDDLIEVTWFTKEELEHVKQIPGGKEFFQKRGYINIKKIKPSL